MLQLRANERIVCGEWSGASGERMFRNDDVSRRHDRSSHREDRYCTDTKQTHYRQNSYSHHRPPEEEDEGATAVAEEPQTAAAVPRAGDREGLERLLPIMTPCRFGEDLLMRECLGDIRRIPGL